MTIREVVCRMRKHRENPNWAHSVNKAVDTERQHDFWRLVDINSEELEATLDVGRQQEKEKLRLQVSRVVLEIRIGKGQYL